MYTWKEMSVAQKVLCVAALISVVSWFVLTWLDESGVIETNTICYALQSVWGFNFGSLSKNRWVSAMWHVMAGMWLALCLQAIL